MIKRLLYKAFVGGQWSVGYRDKQCDPPGKYRFADADLPKNQWVADPFLFEANGKHYLFCEQYEEQLNRAGIGYFVFEDGVPRNKGIVIRQPYHMSYPCVFSHQGEIYMIPETGANKTVELYRAVDFPDKWELDTVLLGNVQYADSTVYEKENKTYLLTYISSEGKWYLDVFSLNMEKKQLQKLHRISYTTNVGRPAGFLQETEEGLLRPAQECSRKYGEALIMYQVSTFTDHCYEEVPVSTISAEQCAFSEKVQRIHTINQDSKYEVVDVFQEKVDLLHGWKIFKRSVLRR